MEKLQDLESVAAKNENTDDEISLLDLVAVLLHYKKMIIIVTAAAMLFAVIYCTKRKNPAFLQDLLLYFTEPSSR